MFKVDNDSGELRCGFRVLIDDILLNVAHKQKKTVIFWYLFRYLYGCGGLAQVPRQFTAHRLDTIEFNFPCHSYPIAITHSKQFPSSRLSLSSQNPWSNTTPKSSPHSALCNYCATTYLREMLTNPCCEKHNGCLLSAIVLLEAAWFNGDGGGANARIYF